uniref:peptidylprolyl isomerase n=1 Tax=Phallusia mammillata TaxID=59560 RepID=A0A6F9DC87_9ASCI|nr:peptidyl-prolyl cis-trans isomerase FKBP8 [Phallusia mammillata]
MDNNQVQLLLNGQRIEDSSMDDDDSAIEKVAHDFVTDVIDSASNSLMAGGDSCQDQQVIGPSTSVSFETSASSKAIFNGEGYVQVDRCHSSDEDNEILASNSFDNFTPINLSCADKEENVNHAAVTETSKQCLNEEPASEMPNVELVKNDYSSTNGFDENVDSEAQGQQTDKLKHDQHIESSDSTTADCSVTQQKEVEQPSPTNTNQHNDNVQKEDNIDVENLTKPDEDGSKTPSPVDEWLDVLGNGLLKKKVVCPGLGSDSRPLRGQEVTITVESKFADETVAEENQELTFVLAERDVMDALDLAVNLMEKEETCTIVANSKYCYGEKGKLPIIPPDTDLTFTVKLIDIQDGPYNVSTPIEKRLAWVDDRRSKGNKLYSEKSFTEALHAYRKCARILEQASNQDHSDEIKKEITSYMVKCHNNLSASHMMLEKWKEALQSCQKAEKLDPNNLKTVFRKGKILAKLGEMKKAIETLKKANQLSPEEKTIQAELARLTKKMQTQKEAQQKMYKRMFWGKDKENPDAKTDEPNQSPDSSWMPNFNILAGSTLIAVGAILLGAYFLQK